MRVLPSFVAFLPSLALLASCVAPPQQRSVGAAPVPSPARARPLPPIGSVSTPVSPAPPPPAATEWRYLAATPGNWTYRAEAAGAVAMFGTGPADARLTLRCDRASRRISLARAGAGPGAIIVRTSYGATSWPASQSMGAVPQIVAFRAASDTVLDQIAYSRGKFAVEVAGSAPLIVPAWAEVSRVIEDCRG
ncbi:hypothetical protein [Sphingobium sp. Z007]|uniref:hypothetical protein n=1 Tax=Sphingobium sp. Z007 TaxID=627495 RepID=UPI000B49F6A7|nr:hypothetical protein [Sphingobium sp. Z007]